MTKQDVEYILSLLSTQNFKHVINCLRSEPSFSIDGFSRSPDKAPRAKVADAIMKKDTFISAFHRIVIDLSKSDLFFDGKLIRDRKRLLDLLDKKNAASIVVVLSESEPITDELKAIINEHIGKKDNPVETQPQICDTMHCRLLEEEKNKREKDVNGLQKKIEQLKLDLQKAKEDNKKLSSINKKLTQRTTDKEQECEALVKKSREETDEAQRNATAYEATIDTIKSEYAQMLTVKKGLEKERDTLLEEIRNLRSKHRTRLLVFSNEEIIFPQKLRNTISIQWIPFASTTDSINYAEYSIIAGIKSMLSFGDVEKIRIRLGKKAMLFSYPSQLFEYLYNEEDRNGNF